MRAVNQNERRKKEKTKQKHTLSPLIPGVPHSPLSPCKRMKKKQPLESNSSAVRQLPWNLSLVQFPGTILSWNNVVAASGIKCHGKKKKTKSERDTWRLQSGNGSDWAEWGVRGGWKTTWFQHFLVFGVFVVFSGALSLLRIIILLWLISHQCERLLFSRARRVSI